MIRLILIIIIIFFFMIYSVFDAIMCFIVGKIDKETVRRINNITIRIIFSIIILISGIKLHIKGKENIDETKPLFIISNHKGIFDIIIGFTLLKKPCGFVAKDLFKKIPFLNYWMKKIDCLFLDRKDLRSGAMMVIDAIKKIEEGVSIWLCPEGTRNKESDPLKLLEFKSGAFKIPEKAGVNILPVAFYNTENVFEAQKPCIKAVDVYVNIGKIYSINDLSENDKQNIGEYNQNLVRNLLKDII